MEQVKRDSDTTLVIQRNGVTVNPRRYVVANGFIQGSNLGVYNNDVGSVARALTERVFRVKIAGEFVRPILARRNAFKTASMVEFKDKVMSNMPQLPKLSISQVVDCYTGAKRRLYHEASKTFCHTPLSEHDCRLSAFVKHEKVDLSKPPRLISPRDPRFNLKLGQFIKHAEKP